MKKFYLTLAILGFILPLSQFFQWLLVNGLDLVLLFNSIVEDQLSMFAWLDVIISAIVLIAFILYEGKKLDMKKLYIPIVATLSVGVSFGLPLFLWLREIHLNKKT